MGPMNVTKGKNPKAKKTPHEINNDLKSKKTTSTAVPKTSGSSMDASNESKGTRICVKNLPVKFTEEKLIQFLQASSKRNIVVTDCKILKTKEGKSRKLAFVGLKDTEMAAFCVNHFHKSYAGTSKLSVEHAFAKKEFDPSVHRPWSKYSEGSSRNAALNPGKKTNSKEDKVKNDTKTNDMNDAERKKLDRKKEEFLAAMGVGSTKNSFWANDDGLITQKDESNLEKERKDDWNNEEKELNSSGSESDSDDSTSDGTVNSIAIQESNEDTKQSTLNKDGDEDMAFLRSKVSSKKNLYSESEGEDESDNDDSDSSSVASSSSDEEGDSNSDSESDSSSDGESNSDNESEPAKKSSLHHDKSDNHTAESFKDRKQKKSEVANLPQSNTKRTYANENESENNSSFSPTRLFIRNLSFQTTESELRDHFSSFGTILECHIPIDDLKNRKGYAFIRFSSKESANDAREQLDKSDFQGRIIHVLRAKKAPHEIVAEEETADKPISTISRTYKSQKEEERQRNAANDSTGWNTSILRSDAVVDNLASRLDIHKSDILVSDPTTSSNKTNNSAAVRLALGETHILQENREYFAKHGFDMEGLITTNKVKENGRKRSLTQILVKNLPYNGNQEEQLHKLFADHRINPPQRMLIPPSKTVVLLDYEQPTEARAVFRKLAYKRFQHVPLYLEWAPLAAITVKKNGQSEEEGNNNDATKIEAANTVIDSKDNHDDNEIDVNTSTSNHSIFVKNLNFITTEEDLKNHFSNAGISVRAVKIPTKVTTSSKRLSMGYGFVECSSTTEAQTALRKLKNTMLHGHSLQLLISSKQISSQKTKAMKRKKLPTKIAVKNIPFQASKSEITALFGAFGKIKNFRLPKKFGSAQHRGFGFIEFIAGEEASSAMQSLSRTHLYGRKLVLEWAEVDSGSDQVDEGFFGNNVPKAKKIRFEE